ncbi:citrate/2-methylcitrate synthase [Xenorhabdus littoralis]|uniref:citrate/2-methylcitrate synthase n=1 Tax=Xenorhabdus littoralis TaxID=2582835 RepID=UPI0029E7E127|nr:citrate/2-methylcitrate synthase [Xenorhabdus sp. psl]
MENNSIDYYDIEKNTLYIRHHDLLTLAKNYHFLQNAWFSLSGNMLSIEEMDSLVMKSSVALQNSICMVQLQKMHQMLSYNKELSLLERFIILLMQVEIDKPLLAEPLVAEEQSDLMVILLLPWLIELARHKEYITPFPQLENCHSFSQWFLTTLSEYTDNTIDISFIMSLLLGGFGIVTPTTAVVRFIASTKNRVNYALIGALCAAGPSHLGACQFVTKRLNALSPHLKRGDIESAMNEYCVTKPYPGFGHPVMSHDIRVDSFFSQCGDTFAPYKTLAKTITAYCGLNANVDYLLGSVLSQRQVNPDIAVLAFFVCRTPTLLSHYRQRFNEHAFGMSSKELREKYKEVPKHWL